MKSLPNNLIELVQDKTSGTVYGTLEYLGHQIHSDVATNVQMLFTFNPNLIRRVELDNIVCSVVKDMAGYASYELVSYGFTLRMLVVLKLDSNVRNPHYYLYVTAQKLSQSIWVHLRRAASIYEIPAKFHFSHKSLGDGDMEVVAIDQVPSELLDETYMNGHTNGLLAFSSAGYDHKNGTLRQWLRRSFIREHWMPTVQDHMREFAADLSMLTYEQTGVSRNDLYEGTYRLPCGCWNEDGCSCGDVASSSEGSLATKTPLI